MAVITEERLSSLGKRLEELRNDNVMTKREMAQILNIGDATYSRYITGENFPRPEMIRNIANTFNINEKWLQMGEGEKKKLVVPEKTRQEAIAETVRAKIVQDSVVYSAENEAKLKDITTVIGYIKQMDLPIERKRRIHKTLSEFRSDLECKVLFGESR